MYFFLTLFTEPRHGLSQNSSNFILIKMMIDEGFYAFLKINSAYASLNTNKTAINTKLIFQVNTT